jgi:VCBS repeat-containing protein
LVGRRGFASEDGAEGADVGEEVFLAAGGVGVDEDLGLFVIKQAGTWVYLLESKIKFLVEKRKGKMEQT